MTLPWTQVNPGTGEVMVTGTTPTSATLVEKIKHAAVNSECLMTEFTDGMVNYWASMDLTVTPNTGTLTARPASSVAVNTTTIAPAGTLQFTGLNSGDTIHLFGVSSSTETQVSTDTHDITMTDCGPYWFEVIGFPTLPSSFTILVE